MSRARQSSIRSRVRELIVLMICLAPVVSLFFLDWFWIRMTIPGWVFWKTQLVFLIAVEIVYVVALIATVFVTPVLSSLFLLRPRKGTSGPAVARGLLCSVCLLLSFGTAEAVCAVWQYQSHRTTVMPVGGLRQVPGEDQSLRFPDPPGKVDLPTDFTDPPGDRVVDLVVLGESRRGRRSLPGLALDRQDRRLATREGHRGSTDPTSDSGEVGRYPGEAAPGARPLESSPRHIDSLLRPQRIPITALRLGRAGPLPGRPGPELMGRDRRSSGTFFSALRTDSRVD